MSMHNDYSDEQRVEKFMKFEKLFFRIELLMLLIGVLFYALFMAFLERLGTVSDAIISFFFFMWVSIIGVFGITIIRIIKYLFSVRKLQASSSIWRSVVILLLSPINFILFYLLIFVAALASCSAA